MCDVELAYGSTDAYRSPQRFLKRNSAFLGPVDDNNCLLGSSSEWPRHDEIADNWSLLSANKQIRNEALEIVRSGISAQHTNTKWMIATLAAPICHHRLPHVMPPCIWSAITTLHLILPTFQFFPALSYILNPFSETGALKVVSLQLAEHSKSSWDLAYADCYGHENEMYYAGDKERDVLLDRELNNQVVWPDTQYSAQMWPECTVMSQLDDSFGDHLQYDKEMHKVTRDMSFHDFGWWQNGLERCLDQEHRGYNCCNRVKRLDPPKLRGLETLELNGRWPFCVSKWLKSMLEK